MIEIGCYKITMEIVKKGKQLGRAIKTISFN